MKPPPSRAVGDDLGEVGRAVEWAAGLASAAGLSDDVRFGIEVCLEEALANLVLHGRPADDGKDIAVAFSTNATVATIVITDRCAPFDVAHEAPPPRGGLEDPREGGRGLRLLRGFASELAYASNGGANALTLRFRYKGT